MLDGFLLGFERFEALLALLIPERDLATLRILLKNSGEARLSMLAIAKVR